MFLPTPTHPLFLVLSTFHLRILVLQFWNFFFSCFTHNFLFSFSLVCVSASPIRKDLDLLHGFSMTFASLWLSFSERFPRFSKLLFFILLLYSMSPFPLKIWFCNFWWNGMDLTEAEDIKKRWQEYTEELYKKDHHDPDNHNGVITHLEPDIMECEVKWALESITMNKASGGDGIPVKLFQIQKMILWKCCTQYVSKFGKLSSGHRTGKGPFSFQSQRKAMPKNAQTTAQLHSPHTLVK